MQEGAEEYWGERTAADKRQPASSWEGMREAGEAGAEGSDLRGSAVPALSASRTSWRARAGRTGQRCFGQRPQQLKPALQQAVRWSASVAIFTFAKKVTKRISRHPWMIHHTERPAYFASRTTPSPCPPPAWHSLLLPAPPDSSSYVTKERFSWSVPYFLRRIKKNKTFWKR